VSSQGKTWEDSMGMCLSCLRIHIQWGLIFYSKQTVLILSKYCVILMFIYLGTKSMPSEDLKENEKVNPLCSLDIWR
jgi:hypothetical protein